MAAPKVFQAISAVQADLAKIGIGKDQKNQQQGFKFRGIDDILNTVAPLLAKHNLIIIPNVLDREAVERTTANGRALFYTFLTIQYHFISSEDGSEFVTTIQAESMDSGDKGLPKCLSIAYKYLAIQTFAIPIVGAEDPDFETHEVMPAKRQKMKLRKSKRVIDAINDTQSIDGLQAVWASLTPDQHKLYQDEKNTRKAELMQQQESAA
jgi:hypothetical protein